MFPIIQRIIVFIVGLVYTVCGLFMGSGYDSTARYKAVVKKIPVYENTLNTAQPQTKLYDYINDYLKTPSESAKKKKVMIIGYDGCRADMLQFLDEKYDSGINALLEEDGSQAFLAYCGGANYMYINKQDTSTAPGWCSILTGVWADKHKIKSNNGAKTMEYPTMLTSLTEEGYIDSASFYTSWGGHFTYEGSTYSLEKKYCEDNKINVNFVGAVNDEGTKQAVLDDLAKTDCSDFIFSIIEAPDHEGHDKVFSPYYEGYRNGFYQAEKIGYDFINAIKARSTYDNEDWLIIITADHGGSCFGHGGMSIMERMIFIVSNKELLK